MKGNKVCFVSHKNHSKLLSHFLSKKCDSWRNEENYSTTTLVVGEKRWMERVEQEGSKEME